MPTVTETYILEVDEGKENFPESSSKRKLNNNTNISFTKTLITDPAQCVPGKTRYYCERIYKSEQDRQNYMKDIWADAELQEFVKNNNVKKYNLQVS
jgi:hypothetical protein